MANKKSLEKDRPVSIKRTRTAKDGRQEALLEVKEEEQALEKANKQCSGRAWTE